MTRPDLEQILARIRADADATIAALPGIVGRLDRRRSDLVGARFGQWTVIARAAPRLEEDGRRKRSRWLCRCDCGFEGVVCGRNLAAGASQSCARCGQKRAGKTRRRATA